MKLAYKSPDVSIKSKDFSKSVTIDSPSIQDLKFNILNDREVNEKLTFKKFIIKSNKIESWFDREYKTAMVKSPNHYIFLSALINLQKMIYLLMCDKFDFPCNLDDEERLKIWPISVDVKMNGLIRKKKNLMQDFEIESIEKISPTKYHISGRSSSESTVLIKGTALVYLV